MNVLYRWFFDALSWIRNCKFSYFSQQHHAYTVSKFQLYFRLFGQMNAGTSFTSWTEMKREASSAAQHTIAPRRDNNCQEWINILQRLKSILVGCAQHLMKMSINIYYLHVHGVGDASGSTIATVISIAGVLARVNILPWMCAVITKKAMNIIMMCTEWHWAFNIV